MAAEVAFQFSHILFSNLAVAAVDKPQKVVLSLWQDDECVKREIDGIAASVFYGLLTGEVGDPAVSRTFVFSGVSYQFVAKEVVFETEFAAVSACFIDDTYSKTVTSSGLICDTRRRLWNQESAKPCPLATILETLRAKVLETGLSYTVVASEEIRSRVDFQDSRSIRGVAAFKEMERAWPGKLKEDIGEVCPTLIPTLASYLEPGLLS
jgi:hypothetical protein